MKHSPMIKKIVLKIKIKKKVEEEVLLVSKKSKVTDANNTKMLLMTSVNTKKCVNAVDNLRMDLDEDLTY